MSRTRVARPASVVILAAVALGGVAALPASAAADPDYAAIDAHARATMEAWGAPGLSLGIARD
jgi:CubicO group peptidase (beta-lactamase class C family)